MIASRMTYCADTGASNTACPPRRAFVASDARRRGQACDNTRRSQSAFGAALPTPAMLAGVDNTFRFRLMPDT
jgi:hypothetical protein